MLPVLFPTCPCTLLCCRRALDRRFCENSWGRADATAPAVCGLRCICSALHLGHRRCCCCCWEALVLQQVCVHVCYVGTSADKRRDKQHHSHPTACVQQCRCCVQQCRCTRQYRIWPGEQNFPHPSDPRLFSNSWLLACPFLHLPRVYVVPLATHNARVHTGSRVRIPLLYHTHYRHCCWPAACVQK